MRPASDAEGSEWGRVGWSNTRVPGRERLPAANPMRLIHGRRISTVPVSILALANVSSCEVAVATGSFEPLCRSASVLSANNPHYGQVTLLVEL